MRLMDRLRRGTRRGGRQFHRRQNKGRRAEIRGGSLNIGTMTSKGRELGNMMERRKLNILCSESKLECKHSQVDWRRLQVVQAWCTETVNWKQGGCLMTEISGRCPYKEKVRLLEKPSIDRKQRNDVLHFLAERQIVCVQRLFLRLRFLPKNVSDQYE